jgi:hypothetical protein
LVLSADSGLASYDTRPTLDEHGWATLLANLDRIDAVTAEHDVRAVLHPHVGTMIENGDECSGCLRARPSACAWTPVTCSSAPRIPPNLPGKYRTKSPTHR